MGLALLTLMKRFHIPRRPWQAIVTTFLPIVARLSFMMIFFLPVADYLALPSGHTPDTLMKYLSIMVVIPSNIISNAPVDDVFPGIPIVVALSVILMFWGSMHLEKTKNFAIAFAGLLLYTLSPTIASATYGYDALRIDWNFFAIGYYLAWVGLALLVVNRLLPRIFRMPATQPSPMYQTANRFMSLMPVAAFTIVVGHLQDLHLHLQMASLQFGGFEEEHHAVAGVLSGVIAGIGSGAIVEGLPPTTEPVAPPVPPPPAPPPTTDTSPSDGTKDFTDANGNILKAKLGPDGKWYTADGTWLDTSLMDHPVGYNQTYIDEFGNNHDAILQSDGTWLLDSGAKVHTDFFDKMKDAVVQHQTDLTWSHNEQAKEIAADKIKAMNDDKALHDALAHDLDDTKKFWKDYYTQENAFNSDMANLYNKQADGFDKAAGYVEEGAKIAVETAVIEYVAALATIRLAEGLGPLAKATSKVPKLEAAAPVDQTVCWSGKTALTKAKEAGGVLLNDTPSGKFVEQSLTNEGVPWSIQKSSLNAVSGEYAKAAQGTVKVYLDGGMRPGTIFTRTELPILLKNPKVTNIRTFVKEGDNWVEKLWFKPKV